MIAKGKCRQCRITGQRSFLRGDRCISPKCAFLRRPNKPGQSPQQNKRRKTLSEYGSQLLEKQKAKIVYGVSEAQLRNYFKEASRSKGSTNELLFQRLEKRLDNIVFRLGMASHRGPARQLTSHGHFFVNGRRSRIPSRALKIGDVVSIRPESMKKGSFSELQESLKKYKFPSFVSFDLKKMEGKVIGEPDIKELQPPFDPSLIVEFYSLLKVK